MSTWLVAIVSNCARMQLRRRPRQIHVSLNEQFGDEEGYTLSERLVHLRTESGRRVSKSGTARAPHAVRRGAFSPVAQSISIA